jgi:uncharacterized membrane-anchored protein
MPVILYLVTGISFILMYIFAYHGIIADAAGHVWDVKKIYETSAIMSFLGIVSPSFLALIKLGLNGKSEPV